MILKQDTIIICESTKEFVIVQLILNFYNYYHPNYKKEIKEKVVSDYPLSIHILSNNEFYFRPQSYRNEKYTYINYEDFLKMDK